MNNIQDKYPGLQIRRRMNRQYPGDVTGQKKLAAQSRAPIRSHNNAGRVSYGAILPTIYEQLPCDQACGSNSKIALMPADDPNKVKLSDSFKGSVAGSTFMANRQISHDGGDSVESNETRIQSFADSEISTVIDEIAQLGTFANSSTANTNSDSPTPVNNTDVVELLISFMKSMTKDLDKSAVKAIMRVMTEFKHEDFRTIITLAKKQDNNNEYFEKLKNFDLPEGVHTVDFQKERELFMDLKSEKNPEIYYLCKDILLKVAITINKKCRLENEFGMYFSPSTPWMDSLANRLKELDCKKGVEAMAGKGWLSYFLINNYGFEMIASDDHSSYHRVSAHIPPIYVRREDSLQTILHTDADFLVISWPPNSKLSICDIVINPVAMPSDYKIVSKWGNKKPVVFIGETSPETAGATGSCLFHEFLNTYFDANIINEYHGRHVGSIDKAILYVPNGKKTMTIGEFKRSDELQSKCTIQ